MGNQDDGVTAMHIACKMGSTKVVTALIGLKADLNLEMAESLETCLHLAALTYRDDTEGKMEIEDMISELVKAGALAFPARSGKLPDVGDDAVTAVDKCIREAE